MHKHVFAKIMYDKNINYYIVTNSKKKKVETPKFPLIGID